MGYRKVFDFLFGEILKYPDMNMTCMKHLTPYVCSLHNL